MWFNHPSTYLKPKHIRFKFQGLICLLFLILTPTYVNACQCPLSKLETKECDKYDIIFKGKITSIKECGNRYGEALFEIEELYKGVATKQFIVLFECGVECEQKLLVGEEWIVYSKYKQVDKALMDWCSRSRKYFKNEKEDFYSINNGNDYYDEQKFLRTKLGLHRFLVNDSNRSENRNQIPNMNQSIIILLSSLVCLILFYYLFNKYFR